MLDSHRHRYIRIPFIKSQAQCIAVDFAMKLLGPINDKHLFTYYDHGELAWIDTLPPSLVFANQSRQIFPIPLV